MLQVTPIQPAAAVLKPTYSAADLTRVPMTAAKKAQYIAAGTGVLLALGAVAIVLTRRRSAVPNCEFSPNCRW